MVVWAIWGWLNVEHHAGTLHSTGPSIAAMAQTRKGKGKESMVERLKEKTVERVQREGEGYQKQQRQEHGLLLLWQNRTSQGGSPFSTGRFDNITQQQGKPQDRGNANALTDVAADRNGGETLETEHLEAAKCAVVPRKIKTDTASSRLDCPMMSKKDPFEGFWGPYSCGQNDTLL
eukprot:6217281-Amphidinium_carterae.1